jgi:anthranilate synthase component 1
MAYPEKVIVQQEGDEDCLKHISTNLTTNTISTDLPFIGGWFAYLSYEYGKKIESSVPFYEDRSGLPIAFICRIPAAIIIDHKSQSCTLVAVKNKSGLLDKIKLDIKQSSPFHCAELPGSTISEENPDIYRSQLKKIKSYIKQGDIFQANLSRNWTVNFDQDIDALSVYYRLGRSNPAPFAAFIKYKQNYIISSSPERLICVEEGMAETRPIAGTYPRGKTEQQDQELSEKLVKHPKERAEHVMLIDLERNDLGRVCIPGSIKVEQNMIVETYQHVHHIVSSIRGKLQPDQSVKDVIHAVFPGGTITGCPKVRCMQIISELEKTSRGAYTGSLGYISDHGRIDMNILIRTMSKSGKQLNFRAGAGIVNDSVIENELTETRHKALGMINAIQPDH